MLDRLAQQGLGRFAMIGRTRAYVAVWLVVLLFSIGAPALSVWGLVGERPPTWTPYGVTADYRATRIWEVFGPEAKAAGIAPRDVVVAVDGISVEGAGAARMRQIMRGAQGEAVTLTIRTSTGVVKQCQLHWDAANVAIGEKTVSRAWEKGSKIYIGFGLAQALLNIVAAVLLFGRRRDPMAALFSVALLFVNAYGLGETAFYELGLFKLQLFGAFTGFSLLLIGLLAFPSGRFVPRWTAAATLLVPIWAVLGFFYNPSHQLLIGFCFVGLLVIALTAIWVRYRGYSTDAERQQVRWFLLGLAATAVCIFMQMIIRFLRPADAPSWVFDLTFVLSVLGTFSFVSGLVISLLKFRLYDADAVIERSVTLGVLTLGLLGIFAGSEKIIEVLGEEYFGDRLGALAGGLGAATAAIMISPLHHRIARWAENRFQKNLRRLRLQLPLIVGDLRETASVSRLADVVLDEISDTLRARCAALILGEQIVSRGMTTPEVEEWQHDWIEPEQAGLDCNREDRHFPLRMPLDAVGHARAGWLVLGPRPDGSFYGNDEREALAEIADPIARALAISSERDLERSTARAALREMGNRLSEIERRLEMRPT